MADEVKSVKDVLKEKGIADEITPMIEILDQEIVINGIETQNSKFGETLAIFCTLKGKPLKVLTSSATLKSTLNKVVDYLPLRAKITKKGSYYKVD